MLLDDVARMTEPYDVRAPGAAPAAGQGTADATDWLRTLAALVGAVDAQPVVALPYAAPDVPALARRRLTSDLGTSWRYGATRVSSLLGAPALRDLGWPPDGLADPATLGALRTAGARSVVLSAAALQPDDEAPYSGRATTPDGLDVLVSDDGLSAAAAAGPRTAEETIPGAAAVPRGVRDALDGAVPRRRRPRPIALVTPAGPLGSVRRMGRLPAAHHHLRPVAQQRHGATAPQHTGAVRIRAGPALPRGGTRAGASQEYVGGLVQARGDLRTFAAVLAPDDRGRHRDLEVATWRLGSTAMRAATAEQRRTATRDVAAAVAARRNKVRVLPGSVTLGAQEGPIPVTVKNDLDQPVTVRVTLTPRTAALRVRDSAVIVVPPGQSRDVRVTVQAVANGLQLLGRPAGDRGRRPLRPTCRGAGQGGAVRQRRQLRHRRGRHGAVRRDGRTPRATGPPQGPHKDTGAPPAADRVTEGVRP
jgi:hypothetical protein